MEFFECQRTANLLLPSGQQVGLFILNEFSSLPDVALASHSATAIASVDKTCVRRSTLGPFEVIPPRIIVRVKITVLEEQNVKMA